MMARWQDDGRRQARMSGSELDGAKAEGGPRPRKRRARQGSRHVRSRRSRAAGPWLGLLYLDPKCFRLLLFGSVWALALQCARGRRGGQLRQLGRRWTARLYTRPCIFSDCMQRCERASERAKDSPCQASMMWRPKHSSSPHERRQLGRQRSGLPGKTHWRISPTQRCTLTCHAAQPRCGCKPKLLTCCMHIRVFACLLSTLLGACPSASQMARAAQSKGNDRVASDHAMQQEQQQE